MPARALALALALVLSACAGPARETPLVAAVVPETAAGSLSLPALEAVAPALSPRAVVAQYPLAPTAAPHDDAVLSGAFLLRGRAQRFAHPAGGSVVRVALTVTNTAPGAQTVLPAGFSLGSMQPWAAGQQFSETLLGPGQSVAGVLAFRAPSVSAALDAVPVEVSLRYADRATPLGPALRLRAPSLAVPAAAVRALEALASGRSLQALAQSARRSDPRAPSDLSFAVDAVSVSHRVGYEAGWVLSVTLTAVNFTGRPQDFHASELHLMADDFAPANPTVPATLGDREPIAAMRAVTGTLTYRLAEPPARDFDLRITYGSPGKFLLDQVHTVTLPPGSLPAAPPPLAPGKRVAPVMAVAPGAV